MERIQNLKALSRGKVTLPSGYSIVSAIKWEAKKKKSPNPLLTTFIEMRSIKKYTMKCNSAGDDFARNTRQIYAIVLYLARNSEVQFLELIFHLKYHPYNCRVPLKSRDPDSVLNQRRKYCLLNHKYYFLYHLAFLWKLSTWADLNLSKQQTPVKVAVKPT